MIHRIGRCRACRQTSRRTYTDSQTTSKGAGLYRRTTIIFGRVRNGLFVRASLDAECPRCGEHRWTAHRIDGFVTDHECDARCTEARGFRCECACGGKNHGSAHTVGLMADEVVA